MTSTQPVGTRGFGQRVGTWLYKILFQPGWRRWALLVLAVLVCIVALLVVLSGTDYREDPSALAPRSVEFYAEARNVDELFRSIGDWSLWTRDEDSLVGESWNRVQRELAILIGDEVDGLGESKPIKWLSSATRAAYCVAPAEDAEAESWGLFLNVPEPMTVLAELGVERGLTVSQDEAGVYSLAGRGDGQLYFAVVEPWLVISSTSRLPAFAIGSLRTPSLSLAASGILPRWKRSATVRGCSNPHYRASHTDIAAYGIVSSWMEPNVRITFSSRIQGTGMETTFNYNVLSEKARAGGLWPLVVVLAGLLGLGALALILAILLIMIGWGGWLKLAAVRAGIKPAPAPVPVELSEAFREDAGLSEKSESSSATMNDHIGLSPKPEDISVPETSDTPRRGSDTGEGIMNGGAEPNNISENLNNHRVLGDSEEMVKNDPHVQTDD